MEDIIDLVATDASPSDISGRIKEVLFAKASERLDALRPEVAASMFEVDQESQEDQE